MKAGLRILVQSLAIAPLLAVPAAWAQGGTVVGKVHLTGNPPPNPLIRMGADPNCMKINAGKRVVQPLVLKSADGGLADAFVYVKGVKGGSGSGTVTLDQQGCVYHPHILGAQVGQTLAIKNDDSTLHNVHSMSPQYNFNQSQPSAGMVFNVPLKSEEVMLHVKCNVHPWMSGYIGIVNSPYFALSDESGSFKLSNVPAGKQTIVVWHEVYGPLTQTVDVKAGGSTTADFTYTGSEHATTSQLLPIQEITIPPGATSAILTSAQ